MAGFSPSGLRWISPQVAVQEFLDALPDESGAKDRALSPAASRAWRPWPVPWVWSSRTTTPAFDRRIRHKARPSSRAPGPGSRAALRPSSKGAAPLQLVRHFWVVRLIGSSPGCIDIAGPEVCPFINGEHARVTQG